MKASPTCRHQNDSYSNRIVGYSIDSRVKSSLAVAALDHAAALCSPVATIVHSGRGGQLRSRKFVQVLLNNGLHRSMGRVGACGYNAAMAAFSARLQRNVLDRKRSPTRAAYPAESTELGAVAFDGWSHGWGGDQPSAGCANPSSV